MMLSVPLLIISVQNVVNPAEQCPTVRITHSPERLAEAARLADAASSRNRLVGDKSRRVRPRLYRRHGSPMIADHSPGEVPGTDGGFSGKVPQLLRERSPAVGVGACWNWLAGSIL
jgi:hypothetical protein